MQAPVAPGSGKMNGFRRIVMFLVAGLALSVPSGYSLAGVLLWTAGLWMIVTRKASTGSPLFGPASASATEKEGLFVVRAFFAYGLIQMFVHFYHGYGLPELDDTAPFLMAPLLWRSLRAPQAPLDALSTGVSVGALGAAMIALWQVLPGGMERATGFTFVIQFGDLAMLLAMLSLLGLIRLPEDDQRAARRQMALSLLGLLAGCLASMLSGSRGGWIALVPGLIIAMAALSDKPAASRVLRRSTLVLVAIALLLSFVPALGVKDRVMAIERDLHGLVEKGKTQGAINERYAFVQIALSIIPERPWLGHSRAEYEAKRDAIVEARGYSPVVKITGSHVHNDFLQALVRGGLVSFAGLVLMYLVPLWAGLRGMRAHDPDMRYLAAAAVMTVTLYIIFGLSQTFLNHNSGRMVIAILIPTIFTLRANLADVARHRNAVASRATAT